MKNRAVVSERGTITIPEPIRKSVHIHPGDMIEFEPRGSQIILKHLVVQHPEGNPMASDEWEQFDRLVQDQLKEGECTRYDDFKKAKEHSRKLLKK